jgi:hypothetical protein
MIDRALLKVDWREVYFPCPRDVNRFSLAPFAFALRLCMNRNSENCFTPGRKEERKAQRPDI